jgi:hypothetical protein
MNMPVDRNKPNPNMIAQIDVSGAQDIFNGIMDTGKRMILGTPPKSIKLDTSKARQEQNKESDIKLRDFIKNNPKYAKVYSQSHNWLLGDTFENKVKELMGDAPKMWEKYDSTMVLAYVGKFFEVHKDGKMYSNEESKATAKYHGEAVISSKNVGEVHNGATMRMMSSRQLRRMPKLSPELKKFLQDNK